MERGKWRRDPKPVNDVKTASFADWMKNPTEESITDDVGQPIQSSSLRRKDGIAKQGKRGKRLANDDKRCADQAHHEACVCGCSSPDTHWSHLESRAYEATRHEEWNAVSTCPTLTMWLDQHPEGVIAKRHLRELAKSLGRRLTQEDAFLVLEEFGFYGVLEKNVRGGLE